MQNPIVNFVVFILGRSPGYNTYIEYMDTIFVKKETEGKTCKTKSGKDIDTEKYKKLCDNLETARTARKQKLAGGGGAITPQPPTGNVATPAPESKPEPASPAGGKGVIAPPDGRLEKAMTLLALQDKKIKELSAKLAPAPTPEPAPVKSDPIPIPAPAKPFERHWMLRDD